jgi:hypothetical protein
LLTTEKYQEVRPIMITTYERGLSEGILRGERQLALSLLESEFGHLSVEAKRRLETLSQRISAS